MTTKVVKALNAYTKILEAEQALRESYEPKMAALKADRDKLAKYLIDNAGEEVIAPSEAIFEADPHLWWLLGEKNDATAIEAYRKLRDMVQESNRKAKDFEEFHNEQKLKIGNWLLAQLNASGANSVNCGESGKAYKKLKVQASAADWDAFVKWAAEHQAFDAVQKRINSSFVQKYYEEKMEEDAAKAEEEGRDAVGEYPPFLNVHKEYEVVVTK
jgi:hypothetical protein